MTSLPPGFAAVKLRYESFTPVRTTYCFKMEDTAILRVYIEHATRQVSISRPDEDEPSHVVPVEAVMTDEPDTSERHDRTGLRVKGTVLAHQLVPAFQLMLVALVSGKSVGPVLSLNDLPVLTDDTLKKLLEG